jgi:hypothetical protein
MFKDFIRYGLRFPIREDYNPTDRGYDKLLNDRERWWQAFIVGCLVGCVAMSVPVTLVFCLTAP